MGPTTPAGSRLSGLRIAVLAYGVVNAVLYAGLVPLWEGLDEPFHYGYVQHLWRQHALPVLGLSCLSEEIQQSLDLAPVSYAGRQNTGRGVVFNDYFLMAEDRRMDLRRRLEAIDWRSAATESRASNYEAQQAPLAYALLVPFDMLWARAPLPARVLRLRLVCALLSTLLAWGGVFRLAGLLGLPEIAPLGVTFLVFSSQIFYATVAHVTNDWLAVPLFTWLLCEAVALYARPKPWGSVRLALLLGAGLLTKAYFLAAAPFACGVVALCVLARKLPVRHAAGFTMLWLGIAAPWYARNLVLYRSLTGMQETVGGVPWTALARTAVSLPWLKAAVATIRGSLWLGNNSLLSFSSRTIGIMFLLLSAAACLYAVHSVRRPMPQAERLTLAGVLFYGAGLLYSTVLTFWSTKGAGVSPSPTYVQVLLAPGLCLLFIGLSQSGWAGRVLRLSMLWVWAYVIAVSYVVKLIPFYAGLSTGRARLADVAQWYARLASGSYGVLGTAALLPPAVLLLLAAGVVAGAATLAAIMSALPTSATISSCPVRHFEGN